MNADTVHNALVSVVIPVYNGERYIRECLDNLFRQTYRPLEVIVVDDGSTDGTGEILDQHPLPIRVLHTEHRNLPSARNRGIESASGEFIAFLDVDDLWLADKIRKQADVFRKRPGIGLVCTGVEKFPASGRRRSGERLRLGRKLNRSGAFPLLARRNFITPSSVMIRRSVSASFGVFDESLNSCEDWEYWLRLAARGVRMAFLEESLVLYRAHETNMSRFAHRMHEGRLAAVRKTFQSDGLPESLMIYEKDCLARVYYESANAFYSAGETELFEECFGKARALSGGAAPWKAIRRHIRLRLRKGRILHRGKQP